MSSKSNLKSDIFNGNVAFRDQISPNVSLMSPSCLPHVSLMSPSCPPHVSLGPTSHDCILEWRGKSFCTTTRGVSARIFWLRCAKLEGQTNARERGCHKALFDKSHQPSGRRWLMGHPSFFLESPESPSTPCNALQSPLQRPLQHPAKTL